MSKAVIGLDGLSPRDIPEYDIPGEWHTHKIASTVHTCPSWNAIFTGRVREGVHDFWKIPDEYAPDTSLASQSGDRYTYDDLQTEDYIWERFADVAVVSAPVVLPTHSTVWDNAPLEYGWPTTREELSESITALKEKTLACENVVTVFPVPDKCNHLTDNDQKDYTPEDKRKHFEQMKDAVAELTDEFDEYVLVSDHGRPSPREYIRDDLWVASHHDTGVVRSNSIDTSDVMSNTDVYDVLVQLFKA